MRLFYCLRLILFTYSNTLSPFAVFSDLRSSQRSRLFLPATCWTSHRCAMEVDFDAAMFGDAASCGGYSQMADMSGDDSDGCDYHTPKQKQSKLMMGDLWALPLATPEVSSSTSASSSSMTPVSDMIHRPLDLAGLFANAAKGSSETHATDTGVGTRYAITESPPIAGSTLEEQLDWVFSYAIRIDQPWLNFPYRQGSRRWRSKTPDFASLIRMYLDDQSFVWDVKIPWQVRRTAFDRMRGWYSRAYGVGAKKVSSTLAAQWLLMRPAQIARWVFCDKAGGSFVRTYRIQTEASGEDSFAIRRENRDSA